MKPDGYSQQIHPTTLFTVRCKQPGCRYTCSHDRLPAATACLEDHTTSHHGSPR